MTHAFFKALLFMAAGSVISAMAGEQSLNRMGGFKRAMPFTYVCFVIGGLALAGVPPFSGFFSKDEILADIASRGGGWWVFYVAGYIGAILTAIYAWRMIFRAFWGEPCPEARELEEGHIHHAEAPFNPANGEIEDTDVGFPGPRAQHRRAGLPMKGAMGPWRSGASSAGRLIPDETTGSRRSSSRRSRTRHPPCRATTRHVFGLVLARAGRRGICVAYRVWVRRPGTAPRRERFAACTALRQQVVLRRAHRRLIVRPWRGSGASASRPSSASSCTAARRRHDGIVAPVGRGARAQSGFLRAYAALLCSASSASPLLPHPELVNLTILVWLPSPRSSRARAARRRGALAALLGSAAALVLA
jgi:NADH-quinone oxidoreductase subunit L